ncbi:hypothetical protein ACVWZA_003692 [Sphingomonas sp. UYAg733]
MATSPDISVIGRRPEGWADKTMIIYSAPLQAGETVAANMLIARDALGRDETFREYCNRQIDGFGTTLPHFHRETEGPGRVHDLDAFQILFTWASAAGTLRQRVFFISAGSAVVVTFTATAAIDDYAAHEMIFDQGLADLVISPLRDQQH